MTDTLIPTPPSGRRAAATWVTATGVMLLLAAATLFVAVRWSEIPDGAKLAALGFVTIAALLGGRAMARTLPATGDVVFHLGALLLPLDLAAAAVRGGLDWRVFVLGEGLASAILFGILATVTGSVVLRIAAWLAVPVAATGVAACSPVPAALVLAVVALGAYLLCELGVEVPRARVAALGWAGLAATGPVLGAAAALLVGADGFRIGRGTLAELGMVGTAFAVAALPAGVMSAIVLGVEADRRRDLRLAFATLVALFVGAGTALTGSHVGPGVGLVAVAAAFATIELAALALADDAFWKRPLGHVAAAAEVLAVVPVVASVLPFLLAPFLPDGPFGSSGSFTVDRSLSAAFALVALGWLTADLRRGDLHRIEPGRTALARAVARGSGGAEFTPLVVGPIVAAVFVGTGSSMAIACALVVSAVVAVAAGRGGGRVVAGALVPYAVVCAAGAPVAAMTFAVIGAVALVACVRSTDSLEHAGLLAMSASATVVLGGAVAGSEWSVASSAAGTVIAVWALAELFDRRTPRAGDIARFAAALPVMVAVTALAPAAALGAVAVATGLATFDALRLRRPWLLTVAAVLVQVVVFDAATANGLSPAQGGLALCVTAIVWAGLTAIAAAEWRTAGITAAVLGMGIGLTLASTEPAAFASAAMLAGALVVFAGLLTDRAPIAHVGAAVATLGLFGHLHLAGLDASEWYVTPVGLQMLIAGWQVRRHDRVSSWVAYGTTIVLMGGSALLERISGGSAGHALYAGVVGATAVAVGGWRRLSAPLVVGTALLVGVSAHESLSSLASIATWMWFAAGGIALIVVGVVLEQHDQGPVEAGKRLVEVLGERFG